MPQCKRRIRVETRRPNRITNSKPIPHIPLPFEEVMEDVRKVKPPEKDQRKPDSPSRVLK
jgi:hypothetical protein